MHDRDVLVTACNRVCMHTSLSVVAEAGRRHLVRVERPLSKVDRGEEPRLGSVRERRRLDSDRLTGEGQSAMMQPAGELRGTPAGARQMAATRLAGSVLLAVVLMTAGGAIGAPADEIVIEASKFCRNTPTGQSYPSFAACMDAQKDGAKLLIKAIQRGCRDSAMHCIASAKYEGPTDFAAAGICVVVEEPDLTR